MLTILFSTTFFSHNKFSFGCAQHTGMHIVVVEALLNCYLPRKRADTYRHKKTLSVECLSRAISWSLSS